MRKLGEQGKHNDSAVQVFSFKQSGVDDTVLGRKKYDNIFSPIYLLQMTQVNVDDLEREENFSNEKMRSLFSQGESIKYI